MLRSMYSGISGMKTNQTKLDVIGNNISNVSTTSFKSSRATFSDLLSQSSSSAQAASSTKGGINAKQVGLGVQLSSIDRIMSQGSMQSTSRSLDIGIDGNGYLMVSTGPSISGDGTIEVSHKAGSHSISQSSLASSGASINYTRDGSLTLDDKGNLVTTSGYRVLGYSVTNDDNSQAATAQRANAVTLAGLTFSFGAGTQLNGYKIQLGTIGEGTPTSANLNKANKTITLNGDFSTGSNMTADQIQQALKSELASKGISQTVAVAGTLKTIPNLESENTVSGGTDAAKAGNVSCFGYNFSFGTGAGLEGYKIKIGNITNADGSSGLTADVEGNTIILNGDFLNNKYDARTVESAINNQIRSKGVEVKVTGNGTNLSSLKDVQVKNISTPSKATMSYNNSADNVSGFHLNVAASGDELQGKTVTFINSTTASATGEVSVNGAKITVTANFESPDFDVNKLNEKIKNKLVDGQGWSAYFQVDPGTSFDPLAKNHGASFTGGVSASTPTLTIGGFTVALPDTKSLNDLGTDVLKDLAKLKFSITNINSERTEAKLSGDTIQISGNFAGSNSVKTSDLEAALKEQIAAYLKVDKSKLDDLKVTGNNTSYDNMVTDTITGGTSLKQADAIKALGFTFQPTESSGATLNGYRIVVGTVTAGTTTSVNINKNSKVITINGDFVTEGAVTSQSLSTVLDKQLRSTFGNNVGMTVTDGGQIVNLDGSAESESINGGTSVQSINADGTVQFVSASTDVRAYDNSLKTLKIPEKIVDSNGNELSVVSYSISSKGIITASLSDGSIAALGQIALANFSNPAGLTSTGGNLFTESSNSGSATIMSGMGTTGEDNSGSYGDMLSGYLEMSNVDLAEQFTDMITATKAFQGSAKMITTGDDILSEIINLKR